MILLYPTIDKGGCIDDDNQNDVMPKGKYGIVQRGSKYQKNFKTYIKETSSGVIVSPFHDIPLKTTTEHLDSGKEVGNSPINFRRSYTFFLNKMKDIVLYQRNI